MGILLDAGTEILITAADKSPDRLPGLTPARPQVYEPSVRIARNIAPAVVAIVLFAACSSGDTQVEGGGTQPTGPTATGPTASGPTGETATGGEFDGAVSLDLSGEQNPTGAAMYSCDGLEGTWTYEPGELSVEGIEFTFDATPVDMAGGNGTLVITGEIKIPGAGGAGFTDTVKLSITGTADAPAMEATGVKVEASGAVEGFGFDIAQFFPEKVAIPIVTGAPQC
jgi:hypothetical protein